MLSCILTLRLRLGDAAVKNTLYYGDNLEVLRKYIPDGCVDLVYLDPPFNSNQDYNVLFRERDGTQSHAQVKAFEDTWTWDQEAALAYETTVEQGGDLALVLNSMHGYLGQSDMMAYLSMMAPRLQELHRVIKDTGSLYLHCDPTASHYLKLLLDAIFGPKNFKNEIIWKRSHAHSKVKKYGPIHDVILYYTKNNQNYYWSTGYGAYDEEYIKANFRYSDSDGRLFNAVDMSANNPGFIYEWKGRKPPEGRYWSYAERNMKRLEEEGRIYYTSNGVPREKKYLDEMQGVVLQDIWIDIPPISSHAAERLGYPTQKPEPLLERIINVSCPTDGVVLDPFCGCGTTISVAHRLNRTWLGIDITHLAITLIRSRLRDSYGEIDYDLVGEPTSLSGARELALQDRFQFQWWALGKIGCRPLVQKKGADHGIDGRIFFHDEVGTITKSKQIIISVKSGGVSVKDVRDLAHVVQREKAEIGVLLTLEPATKPMITEAAGEGFYTSPLWDEKYPRLQILTIEQILAGEKIKSPQYRADDRVKVAPKIEVEKKGKQLKLTWSQEDQDGGESERDDDPV